MGLFHKIRATLTGRMSLTLLDQLIASGSNFCSGIILARTLGIEAFGVFSILWILLLLCNTLQNALITGPMMTLAPKMTKEASATYFGSILVQQTILLWVAIAALKLWMVLGTESMAPVQGYHLKDLFYPVMAVVLTYGWQDFWRRYFFTIQQPKLTLINDIISSGGQVLVLAWLMWSHQLTLAGTLWVMAATSGLAVTIGFIYTQYQSHRTSAPIWRWEWSAFCESVRRHAAFGSWLTLSNVGQWAGSQGLILLAGGLLGPAAVGGVRAVINLASPVNILMQGLQNHLPVRSSEIHQASNGTQTAAYFMKVGIILVVFLTLVGVTMTTLAPWLMNLFYGPAYTAFAPLVGWQSVYVVLSGLLLPITFYFRTLESNRRHAVSLIIAAPIALALTAWGLNIWGEPMVFFGLITNQLLALTFLMIPTILPKKKIIAVESFGYGNQGNV